MSNTATLDAPVEDAPVENEVLKYIDQTPVFSPGMTEEQLRAALEAARVFGRAYIVPQMIDPNPFQPRKEFSQAELESLAESADKLLLNMPSVRLHPEWEKLVTFWGHPDQKYLANIFQMIDGERRKRGVQWLNEQSDPHRHYGPLPCVVVFDLSDEDMLKLAMDADAQHKHFNAIERAWGYAKLEDMGMQQDAIAARYNLSQSAISNYIRLLKLPDENTPVEVVGREAQWNDVQGLIAKGRLDVAHGIALCSIADDPEGVRDFAQKVIEGEWTQKALVEEIKAYREAKERERQPSLIDAEAVEDSSDEAAVENEAETEADESEASDSVSKDESESNVENSTSKPAKAKNGDFLTRDGVQWDDGNGHAKTGIIAEVGSAIYWVQPTGTSGASKRKEFKKKNCILRFWDRKSAPDALPAAAGSSERSDIATPDNSTPADETTSNDTSDTGKTAAASDTAVSTPAPKAEPEKAAPASPAAPVGRKAPEGFTPTFAPTDDMFACEDAGLTVVDVYACMKRVITLAEARSITVEDYLAALEAE